MKTDGTMSLWLTNSEIGLSRSETASHGKLPRSWFSRRDHETDEVHLLLLELPMALRTNSVLRTVAIVSESGYAYRNIEQKRQKHHEPFRGLTTNSSGLQKQNQDDDQWRLPFSLREPSDVCSAPAFP